MLTNDTWFGLTEEDPSAARLAESSSVSVAVDVVEGGGFHELGNVNVFQVPAFAAQ